MKHSLSVLVGIWFLFALPAKGGFELGSGSGTAFRDMRSNPWGGYLFRVSPKDSFLPLQDGSTYIFADKKRPEVLNEARLIIQTTSAEQFTSVEALEQIFKGSQRIRVGNLRGVWFREDGPSNEEYRIRWKLLRGSQIIDISLKGQQTPNAQEISTVDRLKDDVFLYFSSLPTRR